MAIVGPSQLQPDIAPAVSGKANELTTIIVIKPQECGLDTNPLVTTDWRAYHPGSISKPVITSRVSFSYPNDDATKGRWKDYLAKHSEANRLGDEDTGRTQ